LPACGPDDGPNLPALGKSQQPVIYGSDSRVDVADVLGNMTKVQAASAVGVLTFKAGCFTGNYPGPYFCAMEIDPATANKLYATAKNVTFRQPLCSGQRFSSEGEIHYAAQNCTAFWVGGDTFVTAGHCLKRNNDTVDQGLTCKQAYVFMDFDAPAYDPISGRPVTEGFLDLKRSRYHCTKIEDTNPLAKNTTNPPGNDWTVFQVDRPVTGHHPLRVRRFGTPAVGETVGRIGVGMGLPLKLDYGGSVKAVNSTAGTLGYSGDVFEGDSGGPVINQTSGLVDGIQTLVKQVSSFNEITGPNGTKCSTYAPACSNSTGCPGWSTAALVNNSSLLAQISDPSGLYGDFDGDGQTDSVTLHQGTLLYAGVYVLDIDSSQFGKLTFPTLIPATVSLDGLLHVEIGDYNGDHIPDAIVNVVNYAPIYIDGSTGAISANFVHAGFLGGAPNSIAPAYQSVAAADVNEDGVRDLVAIPEGGGTPQVLLGGPSLTGGSGGLSPVLTVPPDCGTQGGGLEQVNAVQCYNGTCYPSLTDYRSTRAIAVVPGSVVGSSASALLAIDCPGPPGTGQRSEIRMIDPGDNSTFETLSLSKGSNWRAFAYRAKKKDLIALESSDDPGAKFRVDRIDIATGQVQQLFKDSATDSVGFDAIATGLGWDASAQQIHVLFDPDDPVSNRDAFIQHYLTDGTAKSSDLVKMDTGCLSIPQTSFEPEHLGGLLAGASGDAVACNGGFGIAFPDFNASSTLFPVGSLGNLENKPYFYTTMLHDVACDPLTYAGQLKTVVWGVMRGGR